MSSLRSGLDELRSTELRHLSNPELEDRLSEIRRASGVLEAETARTVAEIERRGSFADSGHLSMASFLEHRFGTSWGEAANQIRVARALEAMPAVREALYEGEVSPSAVSQLVAAQEASPEEFASVEETLVEAARTLPVRDLRRAVQHWRDAVEPEAAQREEAERYDRRGLCASPSFEGMVRMDGNLDNETGETVLCALRSVMDPWVRNRARGRSPDPGPDAVRRAGGDLQAVPGPLGPGRGGRGAPPTSR